MTQPEVYGPEVPDEESLAFEEAAVLAVTGALAGTVATLVASMVATFVVAAGATTLSAAAGQLLGAALAKRIRDVRWRPMAGALQKVAADGRDLGTYRAARSYRGTPEHDRAARTNWRAYDPVPPVPDVDQVMVSHLQDAARMAEALGMRRKSDVHAVAGKVRQGLSRVEGSARYVANEGINVGTAAVAREAGHRLLWVAERNACLHCLAHAGWVVEPGAVFPPVSFDPRDTRTRAVPWPPLHPNCRCQVRPYSGPAGRPDPDRSRVDPAARLAAEARRTVVYQWTDYASGPAAARAAEALLAAGADLPTTVERRARAALRSGRTVRRPR